jgi:hypothetical protein
MHDAGSTALFSTVLSQQFSGECCWLPVVWGGAGLLGVCGASDVRAVLALRDKGEHRGQLALDMLVYRCEYVNICYHTVVYACTLYRNFIIITALPAHFQPVGYKSEHHS